MLAGRALRPHCRDSLTAWYLQLRRSPSIIEIRQRDARERVADCAFDVANVGFFIRSHERKGRARQLGSPCAAYTVDIVVRRRWDIEVHDVAERFDVNATRGNVGRDEHRKPSALEPRKRVRALALRSVAVNPLGVDAEAY